MIIFLATQLALADPLKDLYFTLRDLAFLSSKIKPITKWKTTPKIKTGCKMNCTTGLFPIKCDKKLKVFSLKTEVILIVKCGPKKSIRKRPDRAMATFLAMVVVIILIGLLQQN